MKIKLVKITNNFNKLIIGDTIIWFSYETPIAFKVKITENLFYTYIAKNEWSKTTAKHINLVKKEFPIHIEVSYDVLKEMINNYI